MEGPIAASFGAVLRREREAADISQEELANRAGLHRTYVSMIERPAKPAACSLRYRAAGFPSETIWAVCANRLAGSPFAQAAEHHFGTRLPQADIVSEVRLRNPDLSFDAVALLIDENGAAE